MFKVSPLRKRQVIGGVIGLVLGSSLFYILTLDSTEAYVSIGPMNTGHQDLSCFACHADAKGNLMQQIQSNISHAFGARSEGVDFGTQDVTVDNCLECHDRANDRHPTYRFSEPRFKDAIKVINATTCITCHTEHHDKERVSLKTADYCMNCHQKLVVENDPLDISHEDLISNQQWTTCIQCHDFHGNHRYEVPEQMKDTIPLLEVKKYFEGGTDPYGTDKKYIALSQEEWLKKLNKN
ncbi:cytochrome c3 family protein [Seonamhaeicola aphaedonensis]|uniref:Cytochrome c3-like protein n=1 Tax=Seonamhaeicola aphaedonensis TaxID=1461338 RepID=A0A3D9H5W6_9FLAO|nr:cytochrome c3 family protein [Seonamhaeicola aphaedonensis]RED44890.1 cytochrome c3-like protein [Seonamhaeicola aphaedonensis]